MGGAQARADANVATWRRFYRVTQPIRWCPRCLGTGNVESVKVFGPNDTRTWYTPQPFTRCPDCQGCADLEVLAAIRRRVTIQALGGDPNERLAE